MPWLLRWSAPVILGAIEPHSMDRFWADREADVLACVSAPVEVRLVVDARCVVLAASGGACLSGVLVGEEIPAPYCGCGVAYVTQTLSRQPR